MKPTQEQQTVITTQGQNLIVEAGAGTGKTWALVGRFIHLLDQHPDWPLESIIAITFTIKAAREMRSRVRSAIEARAHQFPEDLIWQERRRNLDRLQISTIHSLCAKILRENAIAAQIDPKFVVLEEQGADLLGESAVRETIHQMVEGDHPALALLEMLNVRELKSEMLNLLSKRGILRLLFEKLPQPEALIKRWQAGLEEMRAALWAQQTLSDEYLLLAIDEFPSIRIADPTDKLAQTVELAQVGCEALKNGNLLSACYHWEKIDRRGGKQDNWGGKESLAELKLMLKAFQDATKILKKFGALQEIGDLDMQSAEHLQLWRKLWDLLNQVYDSLKDEQQALDFDDLEYLTVKLSLINPVPPRFQAFLDGIHHLMVDEFQDINPVQKGIITALTPIADQDKLFAVGDAKQSIYRFRQAQVSIFNQTADEIQQLTGSPPLPLSISFRTHHRLVSALNDLFSEILKPLVGGKYQDFEAKSGPLSAHRQISDETQPCVEMLLLPSKDLNDETISAEEARIGEARWIADRLMQLKSEKCQVWDKDSSTYQDFQFKDAAVLFRATTNLPLYEAEFKAAGLPYLTVGGRGYYDRPEVQDLIALLSALHNPQDDLNLAAALRAPLFALSDETLYRLRRMDEHGAYQKKPIPLKVALNHPPKNDQMGWVQKSAAIFEELWALSGHYSVWQLLRHALDLTGFEATLAINDAHSGRQLSNVQKFLTQARDQSHLSLGEFLSQLKDLQSREAREGEALGSEPESGAVQLMSIHAAKGLEFPVVIVADLGRDRRANSESPYLLHDPQFGIVSKVRDQMGDWADPVPAGYGWAKWINESMEAAEDKRLLYVACTRAADLLIITGKLGGKDTWLTQILDAWGLDQQGLPDDIYEQSNYQIRIFRPDELPEHPTITHQNELITSQSFDQLPALAKPLPISKQVSSLSTTAFVSIIEKKKQGQQNIRPVVWDQTSRQYSAHVPGYLLGNLVHHVLSHGFFTPITQGEITKILQASAHHNGLSGEQKTNAVSFTNLMLDRLKIHQLYGEITQAKQIFHELPFNWQSPVGPIHGVIDLLYQGQQGGWHLIDWKTEFIPEQSSDQFADQHTLQLAIYAQAASEVLGITPSVELVCLNPIMRLIPVQSSLLEETWKKILMHVQTQP